MTDPISDMLTRIRNAYATKKADVIVPYSRFKHNLAKLLAEEGWVGSMDVKEVNGLKNLSVHLKYNESGSPVVSGIKRVSKPGMRIYFKTAKIPSVRGGLGVTIVSTSKGLMTDKLARQQKVGGEIICQIW